MAQSAADRQRTYRHRRTVWERQIEARVRAIEERLNPPSPSPDIHDKPLVPIDEWLQRLGR